MEIKKGNAPTTISEITTNPGRWVDEHGDILYSYAVLRVREHGLAEDLVQDTFLAALKAAKQFQGRSSERTWLIGILKHKIMDFFRKSVKEQPISVADFHDSTMEKAYNLEGNLLAGASQRLSDPTKSLEEKEFFKHFQQALGTLPKRLSQVFILHELDGLKGAEICDLLGISSSNLWVMLYRARMQLKSKLGHMWQGSTNKQRAQSKGKRSLPNQALSCASQKG